MLQLPLPRLRSGVQPRRLSHGYIFLNHADEETARLPSKLPSTRASVFFALNDLEAYLKSHSDPTFRHPPARPRGLVIQEYDPTPDIRTTRRQRPDMYLKTDPVAALYTASSLPGISSDGTSGCSDNPNNSGAAKLRWSAPDRVFVASETRVNPKSAI